MFVLVNRLFGTVCVFIYFINRMHINCLLALGQEHNWSESCLGRVQADLEQTILHISVY